MNFLGKSYCLKEFFQLSTSTNIMHWKYKESWEKLKSGVQRCWRKEKGKENVKCSLFILNLPFFIITGTFLALYNYLEFHCSWLTWVERRNNQATNWSKYVVVVNDEDWIWRGVTVSMAVLSALHLQKLMVHQLIQFPVLARAGRQGTTTELKAETFTWRAELGRGKISVSWS